jgi:hypothetical protein
MYTILSSLLIYSYPYTYRNVLLHYGKIGVQSPVLKDDGRQVSGTLIYIDLPTQPLSDGRRESSKSQNDGGRGDWRQRPSLYSSRHIHDAFEEIMCVVMM